MKTLTSRPLGLPIPPRMLPLSWAVQSCLGEGLSLFFLTLINSALGRNRRGAVSEGCSMSYRLPLPHTGSVVPTSLVCLDGWEPLRILSHQLRRMRS